MRANNHQPSVAIADKIVSVSPFSLIQNFKEKAGTFHQATRQQFWNKRLPFYTVLSGSASINLKEYPDGHIEMVCRRINTNGSFTDEVMRFYSTFL